MTDVMKSSITFLLNPVSSIDLNAIQPTACSGFNELTLLAVKSSTRHQKCEVQDCSRLVASRKRCVRHGGGPRCQHPGCSNGAMVSAGRTVDLEEESFTGQVRVRSRVQVTGFLLVFLIRAAIAKP
ncbi:hypothetical protein AC1031_009975 [Aphanomyces cochlioides]|nr:hypothetical protein AC1031_009975 [Aphanomyces cochlioides]